MSTLPETPNMKVNRRTHARVTFVTCIIVALASCSRIETKTDTAPALRPSILLVTLDTTRADAIGAGTPSFNALASRGTRFTHAYATVPQTLPSHASIMTGLYPGGHGVHENARYLSDQHPVIAQRLRESGYRTAAFVSAFVLARQFGLARGFETYDDVMPPGSSERPAKATTDEAIKWLSASTASPVFLWVHYFDPHHPYEPPPEFRARYASDPYRGEVAAMDAELGRLVAAFEERTAGPHAILVAADHGEGLGDHGEAQHGNLLYQSTMHVPLVAVGPSFAASVSNEPVSVRRIAHTIAAWAGLPSDLSLSKPAAEVVLAEAMKPFLQYGWQPQVMAVEGTRKVIQAGRIEAYDLAADPDERRDLGGAAVLSREVRKAIVEYPIPAPGAPTQAVSDEDRKRLASLGYVSSSARPVVRKDAPRPADMTELFDELDRASGLFIAEQYRAVVPLLERILARDPYNLDSALRLAVAYSSLGRNAEAIAAFRRAQTVAPQSNDVRHYLAMHYVRAGEARRAEPLLEQVLAAEPDRITAVEALATVREAQGRLPEALALRQKVLATRTPSAIDLIRIGGLAMAVGNTALAIESFEKARALTPSSFGHDLELGVLYLATRRLADARAALDRVPPTHPDYAMALFKRAQVSVLLNEPDRASRIAAARARANATTRPLVENERLFVGVQ